MNVKRQLFALFLSVALYSPLLFAQTNQVNGTMFTLTNTTAAPNGVWSWFEDERAIVDWSDPNNPRLILSTVSAGLLPKMVISISFGVICELVSKATSN